MLLGPQILAHLVPARRLAERQGHLPTGIASLDEILGGGWPQAALAELRGRRTSGRTAILYASLARSIDAGQSVALIDSEGSLDPRLAAAAGITLPRLLWIRSAPELALKATDLVVSAGGFALVALDFGDRQPRAPSAAWIRLKHEAARQSTTILVASPATAAGSFAAATVELAAAEPRFENLLGREGNFHFNALRAQATCVRGKHFHEGTPCAWLAFSHHG
jgi:RecA/RadA recombinase